MFLLRDIFFSIIPVRLEEGNMRLRPLRISDNGFLESGFNGEESLKANGVSSPFSPSGAAIRRWIRKTYELAWCMDIDSRPAGFIGIYRLSPGVSAEVSLIVFDGGLRGRGYGSRAFRIVAKTLASRAGVRRFTVRVRQDNQAALSFWQKMGFAHSHCKEGICVMVLDTGKRML